MSGRMPESECLRPSEAVFTCQVHCWLLQLPYTAHYTPKV